MAVEVTFVDFNEPGALEAAITPKTKVPNSALCLPHPTAPLPPPVRSPSSHPVPSPCVPPIS